MKPVTLDELLDLETYESIRTEYRARVIEHKQQRRVTLGDRLLVTFEDRETVRDQVLEMARVEGLRGAARLQHELDVYNELVPREGELSATLFIQITDVDEIRPELDRLLGIDEKVVLAFDADGRSVRIPAEFDPAQLEEDRISAVHYIRFAFEADQMAAFERAGQAELRVEHPAYEAAGAIAGPVHAQLVSDLRGEAVSLLDAAAVPRVARAEAQLLQEDAWCRVLRPARPRSPSHRILEAVNLTGSLAAAPADEWSAFFGRVREVATELEAEHGGCRVTFESPSDPNAPLRVHLLGSDDADAH
ncbi:MAG: DUF3501 family protein [Proteobacteria bacterium]|nr:DUF3501 family protein [Pseudomonadota bacterium]